MSARAYREYMDVVAPALATQHGYFAWILRQQMAKLHEFTTPPLNFSKVLPLSLVRGYVSIASIGAAAIRFPGKKCHEYHANDKRSGDAGGGRSGHAGGVHPGQVDGIDGGRSAGHSRDRGGGRRQDRHHAE